MTAVVAGQAAAHPPTNIRLGWDGAHGTLSVKADHRVNDKTKHYIMSMAVSGPSGQLVSERYESQQSNEGFSETVKLDGVKPGDKISVELVCNIMGSAVQEITIN
ncbi:hypothetical protein [Cloacibacillus sp. An23]|uniref:hypothetical protein n=1 Tax=Cloacibacillus sp. An23 TaxID=1965591 RepID=UPI0011784DB7|nr:hypothetical protein [Cloacibacillus sp. An23]